jgi:hypothetical protein
MRHLLKFACISALTIAGSQAYAFEITGGDLRLGYSAFTDEVLGEDLGKTALEGSVEFGFDRYIALQFDLGLQDFKLAEKSGNNLAVHVLHHMNEDTSVGLFVGRDKISSIEADYYGIEAGYEAHNFEFEAYLSTGDVSEPSLGSSDVNIVGVSGAFDVSPSLKLTGAVHHADFDGDDSASRFEVGIQYAASDHLALVASVGSAEGDIYGSSASENFFAVGAELTFGANRGATFGQRGLLRLIPGF